MSFSQVLIVSALLAICWPAVECRPLCSGWWPWCVRVVNEQKAADLETNLNEGNVVVFSHGARDFAEDRSKESTTFYYDPSTSGFIDTPENRLRCGVQNVAEFLDRTKIEETLHFVNVEVQDVFKVVCNRDNKICCRQTRPDQTTCSSLATTPCRPYQSSQNHTEVYACPVCFMGSRVADKDGNFPFILADSTNFNWSLCGLEEVSGIVDCDVVIVDANKFSTNEFGEPALSFNGYGLINVQKHDNWIPERKVKQCEHYIGSKYYDPQLHQDPFEP